jgi:predicted PurR-regulated permease PerM
VGPEAAAAMAVVQILANGILQQMIQPFAMGSTLGIHPLAVLIVTIAGGALFGSIGLIIAAPIVAAINGIIKDSREMTATKVRPEARSGEPAVEPRANPT